ncbi:nuclear envelope phosphatase-regulatory subunit 1-like isoform X2 [Artemia franciscana]|uniref:Transmembrane protein 188 n=1 Tax=Artemia franciscana TaxID=6661 RepID=A0AA88I9A3_ARTSF|nr:hypothetical protein QYM36_001418 [Artemia franciscana]
MQLEQTTCEDLKAFERRLTEIIGCSQQPARKWRLVLLAASVCVALGAWQWLSDPATSQLSLAKSLANHIFFTVSSIALVFLFLLGIHKRVVASSILASRARIVLADFNMSCDDTGKIILKARHPTL